jgi:uncharacterized membrane protein YbhN (UPF0104 family)
VDVVVPDFSVALTIFSFSAVYMSPDKLDATVWFGQIGATTIASACHVAGAENKETDFLSRDKNSDMEWMLNTEVFQLVQKIFGNCDIDLFASKDNHQLSKYVSEMFY